MGIDYLPDENPIFFLPKSAFKLDDASRKLDAIHKHLYQQELDDPPYDRFSVRSFYLDKSDPFVLPHEEGDYIVMSDHHEDIIERWARPYFVKFIKVGRLDIETVKQLTPEYEFPEDTPKTSVVYSTQVFVSTKRYGNIMLDMETSSVWFSATKSIPMNEKAKTNARSLSDIAYCKLIALLSLKPEQVSVIKKVPKTGTSAQKRKAADKHFTEISISYTPDLERMIYEKSETLNKGSGGTKSPHMRRGFIKTQRYGPKFSKVKEIFIEAVHVNKDKGPSTPKQTYRLKVVDQNQGLTV